MDEEQLGLRQELEEVQNTSTAVEEELVDTQVHTHTSPLHIYLYEILTLILYSLLCLAKAA